MVFVSSITCQTTIYLSVWFAPPAPFQHRYPVLFDKLYQDAISEHKAKVICHAFLGQHFCRGFYVVLCLKAITLSCILIFVS